VSTTTAILWGAGGVGLVALVWLVLRWRVAAERVSQAEAARDAAIEHTRNMQVVIAEKEKALVETERRTVDRMSASELAAELNRVFADPSRSTNARPAKGNPK
jgi:hypothetical protein